ncbi:hypothetical protein P5G50_02280 [Leifsonia sp. F6_8S_P_1B]|uniref:Rubrerythrin n=1 Tax=Leifsonia williamsii TaxID=3035919 RepID=A0ABT8K737_9MICO|nr:hypothetical protein [Leifsonia williamsii]MDN4613268.1 hypothetical protein [Leifsonia williamsii]
MKLPVYLRLLAASETTLAESYRTIAEAHGDEPDVHHLCLTLAEQCDEHRKKLDGIIERFGSGAESEGDDDEPDRLHADGVGEARSGPLGLLRDLQDLYLLASLADITWTMVKQAAQALEDHDLLDVVAACEHEIAVQLSWLSTRMKQAAPQALVAVP